MRQRSFGGWSGMRVCHRQPAQSLRQRLDRSLDLANAAGDAGKPRQHVASGALRIVGGLGQAGQGLGETCCGAGQLAADRAGAPLGHVGTVPARSSPTLPPEHRAGRPLQARSFRRPAWRITERQEHASERSAPGAAPRRSRRWSWQCARGRGHAARNTGTSS